MMFHNRIDAGKQLGQTLAQRTLADKPDTLVLGIPRGGVVVAAEVAKALNAPFDIVVTKKISAPGNPEYAIGAVNLDGRAVWNEPEVSRFGLTVPKKKELAKKTLDSARDKDRALRQGTQALDLGSKTVIVVDDGVATGYSARSALQYVRARFPKRLVLAVPVAAPDALRDLTAYADATIALETPDNFGAVGAFYEDFTQVDDEQVRTLLFSRSNY